jgi:hypothetical protein
VCERPDTDEEATAANMQEKRREEKTRERETGEELWNKGN